jgi:bifunctional DNA-binding transcriptional regulator/antitoxin component of YhaV-PrlF toxin-antitoxin module
MVKLTLLLYLSITSARASGTQAGITHRHAITQKEFDFLPKRYYTIDMVRTQITSKGQTTIPSVFRKKWKTSQVFWESKPDGSAVVRPVPDVSALFGIAGEGKRRDPREKEKAAKGIAEDAQRQGPAR